LNSPIALPELHLVRLENAPLNVALIRVSERKGVTIWSDSDLRLYFQDTRVTPHAWYAMSRKGRPEC